MKPTEATTELHEQMYRLFSVERNHTESTRSAVALVVDTLVDRERLDTQVRLALRREHRRRLQRMQQCVRLLADMVDTGMVTLNRLDREAGQTIDAFTRWFEEVKQHGDLDIRFDDRDMEDGRDAGTEASD